jgi:hypothetical protein
MGRVCWPLSAPSRFRRKENSSPSQSQKDFFRILSLKGKLRQTRVKESLGLIENI